MKLMKLWAAATLLLTIGLASTGAWAATNSSVGREPAVISVKIQVGDKAGDQTFTVWNAGGPDPLAYSVGNNTSAPSDDLQTYTIKYEPAGHNWVANVTPLVGSSADAAAKNTHTITFNTAGLPAGNYMATIYVVNNDSLSINPDTGQRIYSDVKTVIINLKVGVPKFKCGLPKLPIILGEEMGKYPSLENFIAFRGDHLNGSAILAFPPAKQVIPVTNIGGGKMRVYVTEISEDTPVEKYQKPPGSGRMIHGTDPSGDGYIVVNAGETGFVTVNYSGPPASATYWFPATGTYTAWIVMASYDDDDMAPAIDSGVDNTVKIIMRVGPKAFVDTWDPPRTGGWAHPGGPILAPVAGFAREDQEPADLFTVQNDPGNILNSRDVQGLPPEEVVADPSINSNMMRYTINRGGDMGGSWIKASINGAPVADDQTFTLENPGDGNSITVNYNTSDLPVTPPTDPDQPGIKVYQGYIYVRQNDYFGNNGANYATDQNDINTAGGTGDKPNPADAPPTYYPDTMQHSTVVPIYLTVRGPTISTDYNSFSQTIQQGANANTQTFKIWNLYGMSRLHYSVNVEGAEFQGTKWLEVIDSDPNQDSDNETDKNTVTLKYNASGLKTGAYTATITYTDQNATNSPYVVNITLRVLGPIIATDKNDMYPVCIVGNNAVNDTQFYVWNADQVGVPPGYLGSILNYSISTYVNEGSFNWISCDPVKGTSSAINNGVADKDLIKVTYMTSNLPPGKYTGGIKVVNSDNGSEKIITVNLNVRAPMIATSINEIYQKCDIGTDAGTQSFQVWNSGDTDTTLVYSISDDVQWLTLTDSNPAHISTGDADRNTITLSYSTSAMSAGMYDGIITIQSDKAPNSPVLIPVHLEIQAPAIGLSTTILNPTCLAGFDATQQTFEIWNGGYATLNYTISTDQAWVACSPSGGTSKNVNDKDTITVTYMTKDLAPNTYQATITVGDPNASNTPQLISINLVVQKPMMQTDKTAIDAVADIGQTPPAQSFKVWNPNTGKLNWTAAIDPAGTPWLQISPNSGSSTGEQDVVNVTFVGAALQPPGVHEADIIVTGKDDADKEVTGSPVKIHVTLSIGPRVETNITEITAECFKGGDDPGNQMFTVKNSGVGTLHYTITKQTAAAWLNINPMNGTSTGQNITHTVSFPGARDLPAGTYTNKIVITNDDTTDQSFINVTLKVNSGAIIAMEPDELPVSCAKGFNADPATFEVWNDDTEHGSALNYVLTSGNYVPDVGVQWIAGLFPNAGSSTGEHDEITVNFNTAALDVGTYAADIIITDGAAENSPQKITVTLEVLGPTIGVAPSSLSAACATGQDAPPTTFEVWNAGGGNLDFTIAVDTGDDPVWIACAPVAGTSTGPNDHKTINVTFSTKTLEAGEYEGAIIVTSAGATNSPLTLPVKLAVGQPEIALSTTELDPTCLMGSDADPELFQVWNSGNGTLNFTITDDAPWLACAPAAGTSIDADDKKTITVTYATKDMDTGVYSAKITVADPGAINTPQEILVTLTVTKEVPAGATVHIAADEEGITKDAANKMIFWPDQTANANDASQRDSAKQPVWTNGVMNSKPAVLFGGSTSMTFFSAEGINQSAAGPFTAKTICLVFQTGGDIGTRQMLLAQGDKDRGFNMYIDNRVLYFGAWNLTSDGLGTPWSPQTWANMQVLPNQSYCAVLSYNYVDDQTYYLRGIFSYVDQTSPDGIKEEVSSATGFIGKVYPQTQGLVIGASTPSSYFHDGKTSGAASFAGYIAEMVYYNSALDDATRRDLESNLVGKYGISVPPVPADGLVLWLRPDSGVDMDASNLVKTWLDRSNMAGKKTMSLKQSSAKKKPTYVASVVSNQPGIRYSGAQIMQGANNSSINADKQGYNARSIFIVFQTGSEVTSPQVLWAEGDKKVGLNVFLSGGNLCLGAWGTKAPKNQIAWDPVFLSTNVTSNALYCVQFSLNYDQGQPANTSFDGYINGVLFGNSNKVGQIFKHAPGAMGGIKGTSNLNGAIAKSAFYAGDVLEMLMYNSVLTVDEVSQLESYLKSRYGINFPPNN